MRRVVQASAVLAAVLAAPALGASAHGAPTATLDRFSCRRSSQARHRTITVRAVMRHRPGTQQMALRFDLLYTAPGRGSAYNEHAGVLGQWRYPTDPPTLGQRPHDVWRLTQRVSNLAPDGSYQFRVDFRWIGAGGSTLYQTSVLSPRCREG